MTLLQTLDQALQTHIRPATFPLAVRMLAEGEALLERAKRPKADFGEEMAMVRHTGRVIAMNGEDLSCPLAKAVWGFEPLLDYFLNGMTCAGMFTETPAAGAVTEAGVDKWDYRQWVYVTAAPLSRCTFEPHVIVIYGNSAQVMRLVTARLWKTGGRIESSFSGRIDCADAVITTMKTDECQVILPCYGDRVFAQAGDGEMAFTIPFGKIEMVLEGLAGTHQGGIRYPIPKFLSYTGEFPEQYVKMEELWRDEG